MGKDYELAVSSKAGFIWNTQDLLVPPPTASPAERAAALTTR